MIFFLLLLRRVLKLKSSLKSDVSSSKSLNQLFHKVSHIAFLTIQSNTSKANYLKSWVYRRNVNKKMMTLMKNDKSRTF